MKLSKDFNCVPKGEIYPRVIPAGEDCPPELVDSARALGLFEEEKKGTGEGKETGAKTGADKKPGGAAGAGA